MKEIEILCSLKEDIKSAERKVENFVFQDGEKFEIKGEERVIDTYYNSSKFKDLDPDENNKLRSSFRIREKGGGCLITHKNDIFDKSNIWVYSNELEASVVEAGTLKGILKELHFQELVKIDNMKKRYESSNYELVLESVVGLGDFIEIEHKSQTEISELEVLGVKQSIRGLINKLEITIGEELNSGKPELMLKRQAK